MAREFEGWAYKKWQFLTQINTKEPLQKPYSLRYIGIHGDYIDYVWTALVYVTLLYGAWGCYPVHISFDLCVP